MLEFKVKVYNGTKVIDSRDVATMVERTHGELLKTIRIYSQYLAEGEIPMGEFFLKVVIWIATIKIGLTTTLPKKVAT